MTQPVWNIQQLHLSFPGFNGDVHALNNVSLQINRGEIVGLVENPAQVNQSPQRRLCVCYRRAVIAYIG